MPFHYTDIETRVMNELRMPISDTTTLGRVRNLINLVYRDILSRYDWYWLDKRQVFNTATKFTGTATVTSGLAAVTLAAAPPSEHGSFQNRVLYVATNTSDSGALYIIASHATAGTAVTLDAPYTGTPSGSVNYTIYQDRYNLATDCYKVKFIRRFGFTDPFTIIGPQEMIDLKAWDVAEGKPHIASVFEHERTGEPATRRQLQVHPYPEEPYRIEVYYVQEASELSGTAVPLIPDRFRQTLIYGALARAYPIFLNDIDRGAYFEKLFNDLLSLMVAQQRQQEGNPQIAPRDTYRKFYTRGKRVTPGRADLGQYFDRYPYGL